MRGNSIQCLISLPAKAAREFGAAEPRLARDWFAAADPPGQSLGSGGGTAHLLVEAWLAMGSDRPLAAWLEQSRKLILHGGGQSRRLPAYAAVGKPLIPMPVMRWSLGQHLDQKLLDLQAAADRRLAEQAPARTVAVISSGDVLLRYGRPLPAFPDVDVLVLGVWVRPEEAQHHGVLFCPRGQPDILDFFLQKPSSARIRELSSDYLFLIDSGVWMFSNRAVDLLLRRCGWDSQRQRFTKGGPRPYEIYAEMGLGLGRRPTQPDAELSALSSAVLALPQGEFFHFGTSRLLIESVSALQNLVVDQTKFGSTSAKPHPDQYTQNSIVEAAIGAANHTLWIENSCVPASWQLACDHVLTGVPDNTWKLALEPGVCLDFVPVGADRFCLRCYGIDDAFRGPLGEAATTWFGRPAARWLADRGLDCSKVPLDPQLDLQDTPLFPVVASADLDAVFLHWLFASQPAIDQGLARRWLEAERLSARDLGERVNLERIGTQRRQRMQRVLLPMARNHRQSVFYRLDLESTARLYAASDHPLPPELPADSNADPMKPVQDPMFRAAVLRHRGQPGSEEWEVQAFARLRQLIVRGIEAQPVAPVCRVLEDQIIWGRTPVRLDLAGGWTDTPPYCLQHGGQVMNVAVDLNGQPPIQVFARRIEAPELVLRSIDLGLEEHVGTHAELAQYAQVGSGFAVAKAALALCGFLPQFHAAAGAGSLEEHLRSFGSGIEVALLCAVPKGSGLGTSSILAATLLGTLSDFCGLRWDAFEISRRTLALEQMLTTGGGWQDQVGGLLRGMKLIETEPGLDQAPTVRWLPERFFSRSYANQTVLLYYTGLTRVAKGILHEIVRGMFLNSREHLAILEAIGHNALAISDAIQRDDWEGLCASVRTSWDLNQRLDAGTNPPPVQAIVASVADYLAALKLLGAGGGGYLLMLAKDEEAAHRIRRTLTERPPNSKARFVDLSLSATGFQVTRS